MLLTENKLRRIIRKVLLKEADGTGDQKHLEGLNIKEKQARAKRLNIPELINGILSEIGKEFKGNLESAKTKANIKPIGNLFLQAVGGASGEAQGKFDEALAYARLLGEGEGNTIKKDDRYIRLMNMLKSYATAGKEKINKKSGEGAVKKKKSGGGSNSKIKKIQELLNKLDIKDYQGKKLDPDGKWGSRTRSAVSLMLKTINDKDLFDNLKLLKMKDDPLFKKLALNKKGGPGGWNKVALKLITSDMAKKFTPGADKYGATLYILQNLDSNNKDEPGPNKGDGDKKVEEFTKYGEDLNKKRPNNKTMNLLSIKKGAYKTPSNTPFISISAKQRFNITNPTFKDVEMSGRKWKGKQKGSYMLDLIRDKGHRIGGTSEASTFDIYYVTAGQPKGKGYLRLDGPGFNNYQITGYAQLGDGTLVPEDYAEFLEKNKK